MSHPHPELSAPAELVKGGLRVIPLGGLGEIGRNMTVFEYDGRLLIVDCGVLFPEDHHPGVDLILPDFGPIRDRLDQVEALVLTHGHEDHIGATPYLLRERGDIPLVGSELTLGLLGNKLREHRLRETIHHKVKEGDRISFGPFDPSSSPSTTRSRTPWRSPSAPAPGSCSTPVTSRWTSCRWTAGSPTCGPSPGSARRAWTSS
jgi:ribonuclease J